MTDFICARCHYNAKCKSSLLRHLKRVHPCQPVDDDANVPISNLIAELSIPVFKHVSSYPDPPVWDCGFENLDYLDDDFLDRVITNRDLHTLIETVHFHLEHKENHNVFCSDDNWFHLEDGEWHLAPEQYIVQEAFCTYFKIIDKWLKKKELSQSVWWFERDRKQIDMMKMDISNVIKMKGIKHMEDDVNRIIAKSLPLLRDFGLENLDYLDDTFFDIVITNRDFHALVKTIHFNPKYPCNHNLLVFSGKWFYLLRGNWFEVDEVSFRRKTFEVYHTIIDRWLKKKDIRIPWFENNDTSLMKESIMDAIKMECAI